jgi:DNA adenine methylase
VPGSTKPTFVDVARRLANTVSEISISQDDGIKFISKCDPESLFFFIDPPYFKKGAALYLNALDEGYHAELAARLKSISSGAWVLTYDDCPEVRRLYRDWATIRPFSLRYAASERRPGREILIAPKWMRLPRWQKSAAVTW